nr:unnamed protein product [Digitaria exilis]
MLGSADLRPPPSLLLRRRARRPAPPLPGRKGRRAPGIVGERSEQEREAEARKEGGGGQKQRSCVKEGSGDGR